MNDENFLPRLVDIVNVENLPEELNFLEGSLDSLLAAIFFKNYFKSVSPDGDRAYIGLTLVGKKH